MGLGRSLSLIGDPTPRAILTDIEGPDWERYFQVVIRRSVPPDETFWTKFYALDYTDAQRILFIDSDCLAFKRLDPIFKAFEGAPIGVQGILATAGSWYDKPVRDVCVEEAVPYLPKFNGGLLYYERGDEIRQVVAEARAIGDRFDEIGWRRFSGAHAKGAIPEEPCIGLAIAKTGFGRVISDKANFQNSGVGLVGRLHLNVLRNQCHYLCRRYDLEYVEPYIFHAHFYSKFLVYWRQLDALAKLERYEDRHPFGYMSPMHKLNRSFQRRWLRWFYRIK